MRVMPLIGWLFVTISLIGQPARADNRVALVIGNSAYQNVPSLPNPLNDAADIRPRWHGSGLASKR